MYRKVAAGFSLLILLGGVALLLRDCREADYGNKSRRVLWTQLLQASYDIDVLEPSVKAWYVDVLRRIPSTTSVVLCVDPSIDPRRTHVFVNGVLLTTAEFGSVAYGRGWIVSRHRVRTDADCEVLVSLEDTSKSLSLATSSEPELYLYVTIRDGGIVIEQSSEYRRNRNHRSSNGLE